MTYEDNERVTIEIAVDVKGGDNANVGWTNVSKTKN